MAAVPAIGRAAKVERSATPGSDATRDLYERFSGQIMGYCLHQLGSREEAEDAVQTTFMNAFRGLQRGIVPQVESAWLFKIAHNVCLSRRRSTWRRGRVEAPNNLEVLQEVVPAREQIGDELIRLQDVLEEMPENQRRAILLREWQGLTYREIAEELDLSQSAVETLIFRARRALAAGLKDAPAADRDRGWRKRARHAGDAGAVVVALKALLSGGTAAKVAATALVVAATTIAGPIGGQHARHTRHASSARAKSVTSVLLTQRTAQAQPASRHLAAALPATHHATPAPARTSPAPVHRSTPAPAAAPPAPESSPAPAQPASQPAPNQEQPSAYHATPAPAKAKPGKSGDAPGHSGDGHASEAPPAAAAADPAPPADAHGKEAAPGQQDKVDKPDHGNGNGRK